MVKKFIYLLFFILVFSSQLIAKEKVSLQLVWKNQFQFAGYYMAKEKGFYKNLDIDVDINEFQNGINSTADVISGKTDFAVGRSSLILDKLDGKDVVLLAAIFQHSPVVLLSKKRSDIKTIKDLKNKRLMMTEDQIGLASINAMLLSAGLNENMYDTQQHSFNVQDLIDDKTDSMIAYVSNEPFTLSQNNIDYTIFSPRDYGFDLYSDILFTSEKLLKDKPELVENFREASLKGWEYALSNIEETVNVILKKYNTQNRSKEALTYEANSIVNLVDEKNIELGHIDQKHIETNIQLYRLLGLVKNNYSIDNLIYKPKNEEVSNLIELTDKEKNWVENNPTIKVANEMDWAPFDYMGGKKPAGISIDYIEILAKKIGLKIEFINGHTWSELISLFKNKEIDVLPAFYKNKEREKFTLFTEAYSKGKMGVFSKKDVQTIKSYKDLVDKKIGIQASDATISIAKTALPNSKFVELTTNDELVIALATGSVDAIIGNPIVFSYYAKEHQVSNNITLIDYIPMSKEEQLNTSLHIGVDKDKPMLYALLEKAIKNTTDAEFRELEDKWTSIQTSTKSQKDFLLVELTSEEKQWIKNNTVKVGVEDWAPVIYLNSDKDIDGITGDVLKLISKNIGLKIEIINDLWDPLLKGLKNKKVDLLPATYYTDERATYGLYTDAYYKMLDYIYVKDDNNNIHTMEDLKGKKVAIQKGFGTIPKIREKFPSINIVETKDLHDSINQVLTGKVDALYEGQIAVEYKIQDELISGIKGIPQSDFKAAKLHFFIRDDKPILQSILQKSLNSISYEQMNQIKSRWVNNNNIKLTEKEHQWLDKNQNREEISFIGLLTIEELAFGLIILSLLLVLVYTQFTKTNFLNIKFGKFNILIVLFEMTIIFFLVYEIVILDRTENLLANTHKNQTEMILTTDKLRQSSDDLTHFARTYVVTNDTKFKQQYLDVLDIRNGIKPRPLFYDSIYWDLNKDYRKSNHPNSKKESLQSVIDKLPFSDSQKELLKLSEDNSNDLVNLEIKAFDAMENNNQSLAIKLLHSKEYYKAKEKIMVPIDKMIISIRLETQNEIDFLNGKIKNQFLFILIIGLFFIVGNFIIYLMLVKKVTKPINYLSRVIDKFKAGRQDIEKEVFYNDEIGETISQFFVMKESIEEQKETLNNMNSNLEKIVDEKTLILNKKNKDLKALLEIFDDRIISSKSDLKGNIISASKAFADISGYSVDELIGKPHCTVRHPDMSEELFNDLWKTIQSGKVWKGEVKNLKKDGGFYWVDALIEPEFDDNGIITGYNAIRQDITAKKEVEELSQSLEQKVKEQTKDLTKQLQIVKKAEETIRRNNNHMTFVAEKANLGFWSFNPQSGDASVNDTFATMLGYKSDEVLKEGYKNDMFKPFKSGLDFWKELLHPDDRERTTKALIAHINGESDIYKVDYRMRRKDGTWMWSTAIGKNAEYDDGKAIRFNGVNLDIAEQKELELEIQSQKDFVETLLDSQEQLILTTDGLKLTSVNKTFLDFFSVNTISDFREKYNVSCICETFNTNAPKDYLQIKMDGQKWINYVIHRPNQIHKAMITLEDKSFIFSATATDLPGKSGLKSAVFTDITEMENAKKEIELILSNILLPVLITSKKERKILYANKYAENQYEVPLDKLIGSDIDDIYTMEGQQEHIIDEINKYGYIENSEEQFKTSTNKVFTALLSVTPIKYKHEDCYIGMITDITKQKEMENEVRAIHKHTRDSIEYASLIQGALIPDNDLFSKYFKDHLTIWYPKDIVGGDIYLFEELRNEDECLLMVIDCTGHGVPGAFVTMLVKAIERQVTSNIINSDEDVSPAKILTIFNKTMKHLLKQEDNESISNAGLDGGILYYNKKEKIIKFSGAETPLFYIEDEKLKTIKGDRHSVGYKKSDANYEYKEHTIEVKDGMQFYISTDGFFDQNGGEKSFPFGKKRFISLLEEYANKPFFNQKNLLIESLENYQSNEERNDDITVVGFKIQETTEDIKETIIEYDGVLTQEIITHTIEIIEKEIPNIGMRGKVSTTVIELLQNMMHYGKGEGSYELIKNEYNYEIRTKNIVSEEDKNKIEKKLLEIKSFDEAGIKKRYGELRRSGETTHEKGGGIGLYEIAKLVKNIEYKFIKTNENTYSYEFKTNIVKNKN